jgi:hypothetical protein
MRMFRMSATPAICGSIVRANDCGGIYVAGRIRLKPFLDALGQGKRVESEFPDFSGNTRIDTS